VNKLLLVILMLSAVLISSFFLADELLQAAESREIVVLIHGYNKDHRDMIQLEEYLETKGYETVTVDLPLRFRSVEHATDVFKDKMDDILINMDTDQKISFVGHSTGGLVIRKYLDQLDNRDLINRAVQIATPNQGSSLATLVSDISEIWTSIFTTLESLEVENVEAMDLIEGDAIEIGAIAGNKTTRFFGRFLEGENDGRVKVESVKFSGLSDFIVVPYHHKEIHYQEETAALVASFLRTGKFN